MTSDATQIWNSSPHHGSKAQTQDVPPGYKRTGVGVIPTDWSSVFVADVARVKGGKRLPAGSVLLDDPTPHPYIRVSDMYPGGVDVSAIKYVPEAAFPAIRNYRIYADDIFISVAGTLGIVGVVPKDISGANLTENADRLTDLSCDRDYLKYWLMSQPIQDSIESIRTIGAQPKLALGRIARFEIALPPPAEQHAIAEALSDVDGLLGALEALIAKKRAIKQAAMQQLLTGKTRLPGFSGEWETKRLGELTTMASGGTPLSSIAAYYDGDIPWVSISDMTKSGKVLTETDQSLTKLGFSNSAAQMFSTGTILYAMYASLGECCIAGVPVCTSQAILGIQVHRGLDTNFLYYFLTYLKPMVRTLGQQGTQANLNKGMVQDFQLASPSPTEQTAIATALSDMDAEIAALEARRDKTRQIKQGMMQQLLTGRVRLVKPAAAA